MPDDPPVNGTVSARFARTRGRDTKPELLVRRGLHRRGLRYRVNARPILELRRTADIVFGRARVAVMIDGCFWHGCPIHYVEPKTRTAFWVAKIEGNVTRDAETTALLQAKGWLVLRYWEHEPVDDVVADIEDAVLRRR